MQTITDNSNLPDLSSDYDVPADKLAYMKANGHVTLRDICSADEVEPYRALVAEDVAARKDTARSGAYAKDLKDRDTRTKAFLQMTNVWQDDERIARFTLARRFGHIAAQLLNVDAVRLYHDQALFKEPGGGHTPWHQDQFYWPLPDDRTVTMWMPMVDSGGEMGTLMFASGTHTLGPLADIAISDHSESFFNNLCKDKDWPVAISELNAGDATWHYGWTLHKSPGNVTDKMRQVMTVIFVADGTPILEPTNEKQPKEITAWMPGQKPGDLVGSPLNPIVYSRQT